MIILICLKKLLRNHPVHSIIEKYDSFLYAWTDINECDTQNGGCQHICMNTEGSYSCQCRSGFILKQDKHSCTGNYYFEK